MPKRSPLSIPQTFLLYIVAFFAISAIVTSSLYLYIEYKTFKNESAKSKADYIEDQKKLIQNEVNLVIDHIEVSRDIRINQVNEILTHRVDQAYNLIENLYQTHKKKYSKQAIIQIAREALRPLRSKEIRGDYFIIRTDGEEILYPAHPELEGSNFLNLPASPEKAIVQEEIRIAKELEKGFINEELATLTTKEAFGSPSVIYVRYFKPLDIVLGTGEYIPDIEEDVKKEAIHYIQKIKYGVDQKIFINDDVGNVIVSNTKHYSVGENILTLKDANGFEFIKAEIDATKNPKGDFTIYDWKNEVNSDISKNISFVRKYSHWNWIVGAWFDLSHIEANIDHRIQRMQSEQIKKATLILFLIILLHIVILLIFKYIANKTKKNTTTFIRQLKKAIHSNTSIDKRRLNYSEFHTISDATNNIIENKKKTDEELMKSEMQFKSLFEIAPIMILGIDQNKNINLWNNECEKITGYSLAEVQATEKPMKIMMKYEEDYQSLLSHMSEPTGQFFEYTIVNKNHEERNQFWAGFKSPSGITIGVGYDTTEFKKTLTALNITADKLQEANLTKDKFLSIIAHDLKNPFNAIIGFSNILTTNYNEFDDETKLEIIKDIQHSAKLNFNLLEKLLEWAMSQSDQIPFYPELLDLQDIVQHSISFASYQASQKKIKLSSSNCSNMKIYADDNMLTSLLRNLISNSIKFTPENGEIQIKAKSINDGIRISIKDTGVGINSKNIEKLFQIDSKIQTSGTKDEKGTGIGLLICKEFVDKHGGNIWVESQVGKGTEFFITFPNRK